MELRKRVDEMLVERRAEIEKQLERMGTAIAVVGGRGGRSVLKGKKIPPKYRGPSGETWAGRGGRPRCADLHFPSRNVGLPEWVRLRIDFSNKDIDHQPHIFTATAQITKPKPPPNAKSIISPGN